MMKVSFNFQAGKAELFSLPLSLISHFSCPASWVDEVMAREEHHQQRQLFDRKNMMMMSFKERNFKGVFSHEKWFPLMISTQDCLHLSMTMTINAMSGQEMMRKSCHVTHMTLSVGVSGKNTCRNMALHENCLQEKIGNQFSCSLWQEPARNCRFALHSISNRTWLGCKRHWYSDQPSISVTQSLWETDPISFRPISGTGYSKLEKYCRKGLSCNRGNKPNIIAIRLQSESSSRTSKKANR